VPHMLLDRWKGHAAHQGRDHMAVPEDLGSDLAAGELLSGGAPRIPAAFARRSIILRAVLVLRWPLLLPGKSHSWPGWRLSLMAPMVAWLARAARKWPVYGPAALNPEKSVLEIDILDPGGDQLPTLQPRS